MDIRTPTCVSELGGFGACAVCEKIRTRFTAVTPSLWELTKKSVESPGGSEDELQGQSAIDDLS